MQMKTNAIKASLNPWVADSLQANTQVRLWTPTQTPHTQPHWLTLTLKKWMHTPQCSSYIYLIQIDVITCTSNISSHELFPFINSTHFILSSTRQQRKPYHPPWMIALHSLSVIIKPMYDLSNIYGIYNSFLLMVRCTAYIPPLSH